MSRLLVGIPARNEADRIVELAAHVETGLMMLEGTIDGRLALAYQPGDDDTLERFTSRPARIAHVVLQSSDPSVGKGANVKLVLRRALADHADHVLLVDADLGDYDPRNVGRVIGAAQRDDLDLVLPLWCRPHGQGNTTNYLASPLLLATQRARIRQPLAGHMLLSRAFVEQIDIDALPDDYGIDIMLTLLALSSGRAIGQVDLIAPRHPSKEGNRERVMIEVATTALHALARIPRVDRSDVELPRDYWKGWEWPPNGGSDVEYVDIIVGRASSDAELASWLAFGDADDEAVAEMWADHLADAVRRCRSPHADLSRIVTDLVCPFFVHAEHRARRDASIADLERYVADLGRRLAARLHA